MLTDVIKALDLDVLIAAPSGLGTINSTVLTAEYAKQCGISVKGIIFNRYDESSFLHADNKKQIEFLTGIPVIACVPENAADISVNADILAGLYKEI
jgi:dethiobiotin synthetase